MDIKDALVDGEADAGAGETVRSGFILLVEQIPDPLLILPAYGLTVVGYLECNIVTSVNQKDLGL